MQIYNRVVLDAIEREKSGMDYFCDGYDKEILCRLLKEINEYAGTNFQYLAELDAFTVFGTGDIVARYIQKFTSQSIRGYLLQHLVSDKVKDCDKLVLEMYKDFKNAIGRLTDTRIV